MLHGFFGVLESGSGRWRGVMTVFCRTLGLDPSLDSELALDRVVVSLGRVRDALSK